jgi:UDP-GlcNAc:undecaprenyl-phosphate/decaprenyl-phosphate GlcNAc-1-phosphate transferase
MYALIGLGLLAMALCFVLTPVCRDLALQFKFVDVPDERKHHTGSIPRTGGIPIFISYLIAVGIGMTFLANRLGVLAQHRHLLASVLPAAGLIFVVGLIDDVIGLKPWQKLAGQMGASICAVALGLRIPLLHGYAFTDWLLVPLTVLWLVGCTNAFNLVDGLDGLATGVGLFATLTTLLAALLQGNFGLAIATVPLAGCLLAFLRYNFNPASIFLGDSGSLTVGFLLGCFGVIWSQKSATLLGMVAPLIALALPLFEVGLSVGRRFLRQQPIFQPDRGHIHHRLLGLGFKTRDVVLILYGVCGVAAVLSLAQSSFSHMGSFIILLFCGLAWIGIRGLGYIEFRAAGKFLHMGRILSLVQEEIRLQNFAQSLSSAKTTSECWFLTRAACRDLGFASVELNLNGQFFTEAFESAGKGPLMQSELALQDGWIRLITTSDSHLHTSATPFLQAFQKVVDSKVFAADTPITGIAITTPVILHQRELRRVAGRSA